MTKTTMTTITDSQIRSLRAEAVAAGDYTGADLCDRALATDTVNQDGLPIAFAEISREEARARVAQMLAEGQG